MASVPTYYDMAIFQSKACVLRLRRLIVNHIRPVSKAKQTLRKPNSSHLLAQSVSPLWDNTAPHAERVLQAGKVHNLRQAACKIDGCTLDKNQIFSFWRQVGWPGKLRGYVLGRELRQGCIIPATAGGLCQLSNALYDAALTANFVILERHAHTNVIPGSLAETGRDATIFWNYVDLRFKTTIPILLKVNLTQEELIIEFWDDRLVSCV